MLVSAKLHNQLRQFLYHMRQNKKVLSPDSLFAQRLTIDLARPLEFFFLILPEFPIYALIPAVESLRIANQNTREDLFHWKLLGANHLSVRSSNGMTLALDGNILDESPPDIILIFAGNEPTQSISASLLSWLRTAHSAKSMIGGVDTGIFAIAEAGLLQQRMVTLHWEAVPLFRECYPDIQTVERLYYIDGPIISCAGGIAALDMMLEIIRIRHGNILAQVVANGFVYSRWRSPGDHQRSRELTPVPDDIEGTPSLDVWSAILRTMEENIDTPLSPADLARRFHMSRRTLERFFRKKVGESVARYYMRLRIDVARDFLFYSDLTIIIVAIACGFSSQTSFSRAFKKILGMSPSTFRRMRRTDRFSPYRPRIRYHLEFKR